MSTEIHTGAATPLSPARRRFVAASRRRGAGRWLFALAMLVAGAAPCVHAQAPTVTASPQQPTTGARDAGSPQQKATANIAFFDGARPPVNLLQAFDAVVIDPASAFEPGAHPLAHTVWIARTHPASGDHVAQQIEPLWQRGYRGFLLDTPAAIAAIDAIHAAHPDARLIVGGDDALRAALPHAAALYAVVGPSLVRGVAPGGGTRTSDVTAIERAARIEAARSFMQRTGVPVISIELCPSDDRACARTTAAQVVASGITPYVTNTARNVVGIGAIEVLPRRILVVQNPPSDLPLDETPGVRDVAMPLNYLGYDVQYAQMNDTLPDDVTPDRYAGVVVWLEGDEPRDTAAWRAWVDERIAAHVPVAFIGQFGFDAAADEGAALDLQPVLGPFTDPVSVVSRDPMIGFETEPRLGPRDLTGVRVGAASQSLLRVKSGAATLDPVAITPWGGYSLSPYTVVSLSGVGQERWAIQPIQFFSRALRLTPMPAPSLTTENGRRLFMTHVDGDGFASRAEFPGPDYSGEALYEQIFTRYKVPMTLSVIEGEVGPQGLYPQISSRLEAIARKMFALPYVAIGTHTYSHPFDWADVDATTGERVDRGDRGGGGDTAFSLNIPNYTFNIDREITGSIDYINTRLAPPGKKAEVLQWPGNCEPPAIVVRKVYAAGVDNINGGDTVITKSANSWTNIAPIGISKGPGAYQVFAPNQDENVYTNDWIGPFYGFTRVLETFDMTERPLRFKPIDVYYHMYSGTKVASLRALDQIFSTVLKQPVLPVQITDYAHKVLDWRGFAVAREVRAADAGASDASGAAYGVAPGAAHGTATASTASGTAGTWIVRGNGEVRELHWPGTNAPDLRASDGVTGYAAGPDGIYIHIADGAARVAFDAPRDGAAPRSAVASAGTVPYIAQANGFVRNFKRDAHRMSFEFGGYYQPFVELANAQRCSVSVAGRPVDVRRDGARLRFDMPPAAALQIDYRAVEVACNG